MKPLLAFSIGLLILACPSSGSILFTGKYNGIVIFDRWDGCHFFSGVQEMEISETMKEALRPYAGKEVLIDALEFRQSMSPGDAIITKFEVLGQAEYTVRPNANRSPVEGLSLRSTPAFPQQGDAELIVELRNDSSGTRVVDTNSLGPALLTKKQGQPCWNPSDGPSYPILKSSISFMQQRPLQGSCEINMKSKSTANRVAEVYLAPGFAVPQQFELGPGQKIEIPTRFDLSAGEYEFLAGYGRSYDSPALASNVVDFDVDEAGNSHLIGSSVSLNRTQPSKRAGTACGRVILENGDPAAKTGVYLWSLPFAKDQPRAANFATTAADGSFRMEDVTEGKYILSALRADDSGVRVGAEGGTAPSDAVPVTLPGPSEGCPLLITIHPQPTYYVRGHTQPGPDHWAQMTLISGDAFPFETTVDVQPDGRYEFPGLPAGDYQFSAGQTGSGFEVRGNIDDAGVGIAWPEPTSYPDESDTPESNEEMAMAELETLSQAEHTYAKVYRRGFSRNLEVLAPPPNWYHPTADGAGLIDESDSSENEDANHVTWSDYVFTYTAGEPDAAGKIAGYTVSAHPREFGKTGTRTFFMDESGVIHARSSDSPATKEDPVAKEHP